MSLRSKHVQFECSICRARYLSDIAAAISAAYDYGVCLLRLGTLEGVLNAPEQSPLPMDDVTMVVHTPDAQKEILNGVGVFCVKMAVKTAVSELVCRAKLFSLSARPARRL